MKHFLPLKNFAMVFRFSRNRRTIYHVHTEMRQSLEFYLVQFYHSFPIYEYPKIDFWIYMHLKFHLRTSNNFFSFGFYRLSRLFHSFRAESIVCWGENGRSPKKTTCLPTSRTWLVSDVIQARVEPTTVR